MSSNATVALLGKRSLPLFITADTKYPVGIALFCASALMYLACNHLHVVIPRELPLTWIDQAVPFLPNTVWIYLSEYLFFTGIYLICDDMVNLNKFFYSFLTLQLVSCFIFWVWPTTYPRDQFPLPDDLNSITHYVFSTFRQTDTPANCCPSLHVSSVYLSSFIFLDEQRKLFIPLFLWGTLIAVSTLTTKQHYLIDVVSGLGMAVAMYWIFHRWFSYRPLGLQLNR